MSTLTMLKNTKMLATNNTTTAAEEEAAAATTKNAATALNLLANILTTATATTETAMTADDTSLPITAANIIVNNNVANDIRYDNFNGGNSNILVSVTHNECNKNVYNESNDFNDADNTAAVSTTIPAVAVAAAAANDDDDDEMDLTNLTWLTELRNQNITWPNSIINATTTRETTYGKHINCKQQDSSSDNDIHQNTDNDKSVAAKINLYHHQATTTARHDIKTQQHGKNIRLHKNHRNTKPALSNLMQQQQQQLKRPTPAERYEIFLDKVKRDLHDYEQSASTYQTDTMEKPPFNYSHIIGMAMLEKGRVTLQQICSWIEAKFAFFRVRKKWNNSIRHNLSLHHCFRKIDRNKYEKGKGGYWELGVDPKKCDRKRIRNRKSSNKISYNNNGNHIITATARVLKIQEINATDSTLTTNNLNFIECHQNNQQLQSEEDEELLLDDLDVQQNIDISSSSCSLQLQHTLQEQQQQQQHMQLEDEEEIFITDILTNSNDDELTAATTTTTGLSNECIQQAKQPQQQHYQLGTIIISTSTADVAAAAAACESNTTFNCFIDRDVNYSTQQQNILFTDDEIPSACENVIISSFLANSSNNVIDKLNIVASTSKNISNKMFHSNSNSNKKQHNNTTTNNINHNENNDNTAVDSGENNDINGATIQNQTATQFKNVIVEHLQQPTLRHRATVSTTTCPATATAATYSPIITATALTATANNNYDYAAATTKPVSATMSYHNDNFRPYIDGIEEAFQYLRSIDTNREDILDHLLDISVSDY